MVMSVRTAPLLLIFLLKIHKVSRDARGVSYSPSHICALKNSTVIMGCIYKYPTGYQIKKAFWTNKSIMGVESPDLSEYPEYSQRLQYLGDKQQNCTIRLSHVTLQDSHKYYFRFITDKPDGKWIGKPGVTLTVTDLQVESPERVTEGDSVSLTCKSRCALTDRATFIWYRNSLKILTKSKFSNKLILNPVRRVDSGRYSCAVDGHTHISPDVQLNVMYPGPRNVSVLMSGSGEIVEGDSVTLKCISDSNPPALNFSWFKEDETSAVGSGQSFSALQSGRFYCQAHNQHGSQRSDAVTVTVGRGAGWLVWLGITVACVPEFTRHKPQDVPLQWVWCVAKQLQSHMLKNRKLRCCYGDVSQNGSSSSDLSPHDSNDDDDDDKVSRDAWGVSYSPSHICALKNSTVIMGCTYKYPTGYQIKKAFWTNKSIKGVESPDLSEYPEYSQRLQYLGDKQQNCTIRLSHVTLKDSHKYYFRFITDKPDKGKYTGYPGVTLTVTDLQVESPERVTEGDSVSLTCKSSCALTDRATFIWYRNSLKILTKSKFSNKLILNPVRRVDSGRYSCAVDGHTHISPDVQINVMYSPKSVSVSVSPSGVIVEGDSVTLNCSSDSNPPAKISWFKGKRFVGSGRIYNISKISSDSGEYKCKSNNTHGEKYSDAVTLNIMYPPRNVSVLIGGSGVIVEGDSVTLKCISDSNPPALNFSWFKENETSAVGSGQSFSALQSGRFYCQAHNQHGSQRSDAVTVTVTVTVDEGMLYIVIVIAAGCAVLFLVCIIMFMRKRKCGVSDVKQNQVQQPSSSDRNHCDSDNDMYARVSPGRTRTDQTAGKTESTDSETKYTTIQHIGNNEAKYENLRTLHHDPAVRSGAVNDNLVIYSSIK
ncbi:B-cell receptor CD22-like [Siphateles boraxobius]|uniref:B-cell receptor CD22-like n=1 Tax=Siphateles boraxobius TaxID=180520 RepID=UPI0040635FF9